MYDKQYLPASFLIIITIFLQPAVGGEMAAQTSAPEYAASSGVNVHYQVFGEGEPILIVNGGPGFSSEGFVPLAEKLASFGYQTILFDQRGTGKSSMEKRDSSTITMELMARDMEAIRKELGIKKWVVFGHSFGGIMANYYASQYSEAVVAMIHSASGGIDLDLLASAGDNFNARLSSEEQDSLGYWRGQMRDRPHEPYVERMFARQMAKAYVVGDEHIPQITERLMQGDMALNGLVWKDLQRIEYDCKPVLKNFQQPVLLIQGLADILPITTVLDAHRLFLNSELVLLENTGHYGWLDSPDEYYASIVGFLRKHVSEDRREVEELVNRYVAAIYQADSTLLAGYVDENLQKSGFYFSRKDNSWSYSGMTFAELNHTAATYNKNAWIPEWAPAEVTVFEVKEKVAAAKVRAIWGFDYLLLAKSAEGRWKVDKIIWQSYTEEEAKNYLGGLKNEFAQRDNRYGDRE